MAKTSGGVRDGYRSYRNLFDEEYNYHRENMMREARGASTERLERTLAEWQRYPRATSYKEAMRQPVYFGYMDRNDVLSAAAAARARLDVLQGELKRRRR